MLRRHTHLGRQVLQRQTTLIALAAQEGGDQGVHEVGVAQWRVNRSYDHMNSWLSFSIPKTWIFTLLMLVLAVS